MGAVYEAEAVHLGNTIVAVKEAFFSEDWLREQFQREASTLARLRHPALPKVSDHFSEGAGQFLVMEFIPGDDLRRLLNERLKVRGEPFDWQMVVEWADRLLHALEYIHSQYPPVIHRDIKPENLKLTPRNELFLIDFGLAKDATTPTRPGKSLHGYTLAYAPPEQVKGTGTDARSDLYSLGATLYHLVTGQPPVDAKVREEVLKYNAPDPLPSADKSNPKVPAEIGEIIVCAMALNRDERYPNSTAMRQALGSARQNIEAEMERRRREEEERQRQEQARLAEEQRRREEEARLLAWLQSEQQQRAGSTQGNDPVSQQKGYVEFQSGTQPEPQTESWSGKERLDKSKPHILKKKGDGIPPKEELSIFMKMSLLFIAFVSGIATSILLYTFSPLNGIVNNLKGEPNPYEKRKIPYRPTDPEISAAFARHLEGLSDEARTRIGAVLTANPANAEALYYLGRIDLDQKKYDEAANRLSQAAKLDPKLPDVWGRLAAAYLGLGQPRNALDALRNLDTPP